MRQSLLLIIHRSSSCAEPRARAAFFASACTRRRQGSLPPQPAQAPPLLVQVLVLALALVVPLVLPLVVPLVVVGGGLEAARAVVVRRPRHSTPPHQPPRG